LMTTVGLGKIILLGEHAAVYGYPALAAALDRGVTIDAVPTPAGGSLRIDIPAWSVKVTAMDDHPVARSLSAIADELGIGRPALLAKDLASLGAAMNRAHEILAGLGVSTEQLDSLCAAARDAGAHGAKLTGAGGGGAVIAIASRDREPAVLAAWKTMGVTGFV